MKCFIHVNNDKFDIVSNIRLTVYLIEEKQIDLITCSSLLLSSDLTFEIFFYKDFNNRKQNILYFLN